MKREYVCKACGRNYVHRRRFMGHLLNSSCGDAYQKFGWEIAIDDKRMIPEKLKVKQEDAEPEKEPETEEADSVEIVESPSVEDTIQELDSGTVERDSGDDEFEKLIKDSPEWYRISRGKKQVRCPEPTCDNWLDIEKEPGKCPKCGGILEWN